MVKDAIKIIGTEQEILLNGLKVQVKVLDYKNTYGKDRWLVTPVAGSGEVWVEVDFKQK